jgi:hypothetical protein
MTNSKIDNWDDLDDREKLDRLTKVLTRAGSDLKFRDGCLVSSESAKRAILSEGKMKLPADFIVQFLTQDEAMTKLIFIMPDYSDASPPPIRKAEQHLACSYSTWAPPKNTVLSRPWRPPSRK